MPKSVFMVNWGVYDDLELAITQATRQKCTIIYEMELNNPKPVRRWTLLPSEGWMPF